MGEKKTKKIILIIAFSESIHTARWVNQILDQNWDIHLFPSLDNGLIHPDFYNITVHHSFYGKQKCNSKLKHKGIPVISNLVAIVLRKIIKKYVPNYRTMQLRWLINRLKPDVIHSLEIQAAGYLTLEAKKMNRKFPPWVVTNWGSDIYLFGRIKEHESKIREVLNECDYYSSECERDVLLAKTYGFKGIVMPVFPNTGGFDLDTVIQLRTPGPISKRRIIMLKGYQHWAGRALVGLHALQRCVNILDGYEIYIYAASGQDVILAAELFTNETKIPVKIIPYGTAHKEILRFHGKARVSIGLSISDAISTSFLEAIVMGSFPIQSDTSCANEWIINGETGFLVPPEDPEIIEKALRRVLLDDELVNKAALQNYQMTEEKLEYSIIKSKTIAFYNYVLNNKQ